MSRVKINLCTPLHIGSGNLLNIGSDVVSYRREKESLLGVVDLKKVMQLIGNKKSDIDQWVLAIERGESTSDVVKRLAPNADISSYVSREIVNYCKLKSSDTLKEYIRDGMNRPYIPGSSLKGAIRTAILAAEAEIRNLSDIQRLEKKLFGGVQDSIFRFLSVGDAVIYSDVRTEALRLINLNERTNNSFIDDSKSQVTEVLPFDVETETNIKLDIEKYRKCRELPPLPQSMSSIHKMFKTINAHTKKLLHYEIKYWEERKDYSNSDGVDDYLEQLSILLEDEVCYCEKKEENSCIIRVGHASGWNFITGGWARRANDFDKFWVPKIRPNNKSYEEFDFPKSRRLSEDFDLLGFVKLTLLSD